MFPNRLTKIDDLTRRDHYYLADGDECYYLGEYTSRRGYAFSDTNQLIFNFKKPVDRRGRPEWQHKERAIELVASAFRKNLVQNWLEHATLVPVPPSKAKDDPAYDDRMIRMLRIIGSGLNADIRELVLQRQSMESAHSAEVRPAIHELVENYVIDKNLIEPQPKIIGVFDDLLTTGRHYKAIKQVLGEHLPGVPVIGLFIARRAPETSNVEDIDLTKIFL